MNKTKESDIYNKKIKKILKDMTKEEILDCLVSILLSGERHRPVRLYRFDAIEVCVLRYKAELYAKKAESIVETLPGMISCGSSKEIIFSIEKHRVMSRKADKLYRLHDKLQSEADVIEFGMTTKELISGRKMTAKNEDVV